MKILLLIALVGAVCASTDPMPDRMEELMEMSHFLDKLDISPEVLKSDVLSVPDLITLEGYPVENHYVTTSDGYILNLHRIPNGINVKNSSKNLGKVAFLQHGILCSSSDWVLTGPNKALAYMLADQGYDVWMGNVRGNTFSRNHTSLDPDSDSDFWQFSWHEIGEIDLPAMIDYVLEQTGVDGVYYVGHSQGTTVFYVMTSRLPEYNDKIKAQVSLAPVAFMAKMTSPLLKIMSFWSGPLEFLLKLVGMDEFLPNEGFFSLLSNSICSSEGVGQYLCKNSLFAICGFSPSQMDEDLLPLMMKYTPAGASTKQLLHYSQLINSGKFRLYDYGLLKNIIKYGKLSPPKYDPKKITAPVYLIYSKNDWLTAEKDVTTLANKLGNLKAKLLVSDYSFNHLDFIYGKSAPKLIYNKVISLFGKH